jgi:hypothetical protein
MDNCPAHVTFHVIRLLIEAKVRVITFAPHQTQVSQILDLALFGVLERLPRYALRFGDDNATVNSIMKV